MEISFHPADIINESANATINTTSFLENNVKQEKLDKSSDENECGISYESSDDNESDVVKYNTDSESDTKKDDEGGLKKKKASCQKAKKTIDDKQKKFKNKFRCDKCYKLTLSQQTLDIHKRRHNGLKPYQCPKCDLDFDKLKEMQTHLKVIHGERGLNIICEIEGCGKKFNSTAGYKDHYRRNHAAEEPVKFTKTYQQVCEECGKIFSNPYIFKEHQYIHGPKELYPFQCTECDKAFVKRHSFNQHKMRHAGIKNFECTFCGAKKTTKVELRTHLNTHTKEKKYECPHCEKIFNRISNMRIHVDVIHKGIRRYACRYCDLTFGKGDNLKNHELLHTGSKPHECKECGRRFTQKVSLRLHMKTHNK